jgi:ABC-2 type transport system permease protein
MSEQGVPDRLSRLKVILVLVWKDVTLFFRNRFFAFITVLGLVAWIGIFYALPSTVDEILEVGLVAPDLPPAALQALQEEEEGLVIIKASSEEDLKAAMLDGDYNVGAVLQAGFMDQIASGAQAAVKLYFTADLPQDLHQAYVILFQEWAYLLVGEPLEIEATEEVLGVDMAGQQVPPRQRMLPLLAVFLLMMETLGLSSLLSGEIVTGTLHALLISPLRAIDLFAGKAISGVSMAFIQASLLMGLTGGFSQQPLLILTALLLGALLVTGIGFLLALTGRDMMSVMAWGLLVILVLVLPALGVLLPGLVSNWVKIIPSYYLVDTVYRVINFGAGWSEVWSNLALMLGFGLAFCGLGVLGLRRKLR